MIEKRRRWLIVPTVISAGALAFACSSSSGDDSDSCASGSCSETDSGSGSGDATTNPKTDGSTSSDGSTTSDGAVVVGGPPIMLGQHLKTPYAMAVDSTYVYVGEDILGGRVLRAPIGGGALETVASGFSYVNSIVSDGTEIYVGEGSTGNIYKIPIATGSPDGGVPEKFLGPSAGASSLALSTTHLYWGSGDYGHAIFSYELGTDAAGPLTIFGGNMDMGISIDSTDMFWGEQYTGAVSTRSLVADAAPQFDLVPPQGTEGVQNQLTEVRPLGDTIYWGASYASGSGIFSLPSTVQLPAVGAHMLAPDPNTPWHLNVDSKYIYWISLAAVCPGLQYIPLAGGTTQILVPAPDETIFSFTQDANYIYYTHGTDISDATLVRITKPN